MSTVIFLGVFGWALLCLLSFIVGMEKDQGEG